MRLEKKVPAKMQNGNKERASQSLHEYGTILFSIIKFILAQLILNLCNIIDYSAIIASVWKSFAIRHDIRDN